MNDPKRLVAESHSALAHELLTAAQSERVPDALRVRMVEGFALTLGATSVGAGLAWSAAQTGLQTGLGGAQSAALVSAESSAAALGATTGGAGVSTLGAAGSAAMGGATFAQGASSVLWLKGVLSVCALTGAVGLGSVVKQWMEPSSSAVGGQAAALAPGASPTTVNPAARVAGEIPSVSPRAEQRAVPESVSPRNHAGSAFDPAQGGGAVSADDTAASADARAKSRGVRTKSKAPVALPSSTKEVAGDLGREVRMLDAARRAILDGDIATAREKLAQYSRAFPNGSLRAEAASLARAAADVQ